MKLTEQFVPLTKLRGPYSVKQVHKLVPGCMKLKNTFNYFLGREKRKIRLGTQHLLGDCKVQFGVEH